MGMKEPQASKGNAASKGQQRTTDQTDKRVGDWRGGGLGDNAGSSDTRKGQSDSKGAAPKDSDQADQRDRKLGPARHRDRA